MVASVRGSRRRTRLTLLLLVLLSITLLTLDGRDFGPLGALRSGVSAVLAPIGGALESVTRPVRDAFGGLGSSEDLRSENDQLRQRIEELEQGEAEAARARSELDQLAADLNIDLLTSVDSVVARVVAGPIGNFDGGLQLDRGSDNGIAVGMPVVGGGGLVGRVVSVGPNRATVVPVTDPGFSVGVRVAGGTGLGVLSGEGDTARAVARSFDRSTSLTEGDLLVTSGAARSLFPPDLAVGRVVSVTGDSAGLEREAEVELSAPFNDLRYVTVLMWEPPQ